MSTKSVVIQILFQFLTLGNNY